MVIHPSLDLITFAQLVFQRSVNTINQATTGLADHELHFRPTEESNTIAWLAWHLSRRKDYYTAKLVGDEETWAQEAWNEQFGLRTDETGLGHSPEKVGGFRPARELLFAYVTAANDAAVHRMGRITAPLLEREVELDASRGWRPAHQIFNPMLSDCLQHLGQIAYLRGIITGYGWMRI